MIITSYQYDNITSQQYFFILKDDSTFSNTNAEGGEDYDLKDDEEANGKEVIDFQWMSVIQRSIYVRY